MIETNQMISIFAFGLVITGIVFMGVLRARELQNKTPRNRQRDD